MSEGMPHLYRVATASVPPGAMDCGCCGRTVPHTQVGAFDEDLTSYICWRCITTMAVAEWLLTAPASEGGRIRARRPHSIEAMALDDEEARPLVGGEG